MTVNPYTKDYIADQAEILRKKLIAYDRYYNDPTCPEHAEFKWEILQPLIDRAVEKTKDGTYGICDDCDEVIPILRLAAIPAAIRCVGCQEIFEKKLGKK